MAQTEEVIDELLKKMEACVLKVDECQGKLVKLRNAEVDLLKTFEDARDYMMKMLQDNAEGGRENLVNIFGGDCVRIARIRTCLENSKFSDMYANDQRQPQCMSACESVEAILQDLGLGWALRKAQEEQKELQRARTSSSLGPNAEAGQAAVEEMVSSTPVIEEPKKLSPEKPKKKDMASEALDRTLDEDIIAKILACTDCAELLGMEQDKQESLGNWMIWMVHRAHLNDPTLIKFDFTNLQMPAADQEPRISPKLVKAIGTNTNIEHLLLANTNLQTGEGGVLAESLKLNSSLRVLNVDSNFIGAEEMELLANAAGVNQRLEELRVNNQHGLLMGRSQYEAFATACKTNKMICKLGLNITDPHFRNDIDRSIMRNNDGARKRRVAAKKAAEEAAAAGYPAA